ncbi:MAG: pentapeptide repeat-containing protein [Alphaproteobacteria bacterium]|nr:pentapeptide repeat-containing protein [Alphaproteobacteria bacterium]
MSFMEIKNNLEKRTLYAGEFHSMVECVQQAVSDNTNLAGADLSFCDLSNANLDGALMPGAILRGANLTGANLSEAVLTGCDLTNALLCNACLCESDLSLSRFEGALFGATQIAEATLSGSVFSTLSAWDLDFVNAREIHDCRFLQTDGSIIPFSSPPVVIRGLLHTPVIILGNTVKIGPFITPSSQILQIVLQTVRQCLEAEKHKNNSEFFCLS